MEKKQAVVIDMTKYAESHEIHDKCIGCAKVFDYTPAEGEITSQKCLTYVRPAVWWEEKSIATKKELVVSKTNPKGIWEDVPATVRMCPVATHISVAAEEKAKVNPLKAAKRAQRGS